MLRGSDAWEKIGYIVLHNNRQIRRNNCSNKNIYGKILSPTPKIKGWIVEVGHNRSNTAIISNTVLSCIFTSTVENFNTFYNRWNSSWTIKCWAPISTVACTIDYIQHIKLCSFIIRGSTTTRISRCITIWKMCSINQQWSWLNNIQAAPRCAWCKSVESASIYGITYTVGIIKK